jgi:hypothetical protein
MGVVKFPGTEEVEENKSLDTFLENITKLIKEKKVTSLMTLVYTTEDDEEPVFFIAGEYTKSREILGDLRLMEAVILDEF